MKDTVLPFPYNLTGLSRAAWLDRIIELTDVYGDVEPIGSNHRALLIDAGKSLLVSFESIANIRKLQEDNAPIGWSFVHTHGWSSLTLLSDAEQDWFRHPAIYGYFDRLIDDGFFDEFDTVLFYGAGAAGYAAGAFSVAAPEAKVLLIQPQATLAVDEARWDRRFPEARRLDFSSRYGHAPRMLETAERVWVIHDPSITEDAVHAQAFDGVNTTHLTCDYLGPNAMASFTAMDMLLDLLDGAMDDSLTPSVYAQLWRERQNYLPYLRTLFHRLDLSDEHPRLLARLCRAVCATGKRPLFADRLQELRDDGVDL